MKRRGRYAGRLGSLVSAVVLLASCAPAPAGPPSVPLTPPYCPFDDRIVIYGGDSLATQWPRYVSLPAGYTAFNTARGGSAYSGNYTPYPDMETIGARVLAQLDACGNDVAVVALSGGFMDLIGQDHPSNRAIAAIDALDAELHRRGVDAVFQTIPPVSNATEWFTMNQANRRAINAWLTTPGNLFGRVVDCVPALESVPGSDALAERFWLVDFFGTVDFVHPNDAGYVVTAACVQPAIDELTS